MTVGTGVAIVEGMTTVEVKGVAQGVIVLVLVMAGIETLIDGVCPTGELPPVVYAADETAAEEADCPTGEDPLVVALAGIETSLVGADPLAEIIPEGDARPVAEDA